MYRSERVQLIVSDDGGVDVMASADWRQSNRARQMTTEDPAWRHAVSANEGRQSVMLSFADGWFACWTQAQRAAYRRVYDSRHHQGYRYVFTVRVGVTVKQIIVKKT